MTRRALLGQLHAALSTWERQGRPGDTLDDCSLLELYMDLTTICARAVEAVAPELARTK